MKFKVRLAGVDQEIEVTRQGEWFSCTALGQTSDVRLLHADGSAFVLEYESLGEDGSVHQRRLRAAGFLDGNQRQLWVNGSTLAYERLQKAEVMANTRPARGDELLSASIPAVVSEVLVKPGDAVSPGDKLILLESMKMILSIQAPFAATVGQVNCVAGQAVQPGVQLIELEAR